MEDITETVEMIELLEGEVKEELTEESIETGLVFGGLDMEKNEVYI